MKPARNDEAIAIFFDRCAEQGLMLDFPLEERVKLKRFFELWEIRRGFRVLEPGCGAGRLTAELAKAVGAEGEVYACDLSGGMLQAAGERELPGHVHFARESVLGVRRPDGWFDRIICLNVFPHFARPGTVLRRLARLLKLDGELWINHFEGSESLNRFHREAAPEVSRHALPDAKAMNRLMRGAGLRIVRLEDRSEHYLVKAVRACKQVAPRLEAVFTVGAEGIWSPRAGSNC